MGLVKTLSGVDFVARMLVDAPLGNVQLNQCWRMFQAPIDIVQGANVLANGVIMLRQEVIQPDEAPGRFNLTVLVKSRLVLLQLDQGRGGEFLN